MRKTPKDFKIVHVLKSPDTGGIETFVMDLIIEQSKANINTSVIFTNSKFGSLSKIFSNNVRNTYHFPLNFKPFRPYRLYKLIQSASAYFCFLLYLMRINPNIVHTHTNSIDELLTLLGVCKQLKKALVWTIHTELDISEEKYNIKKRIFQKLFSKQLRFEICFVGKPPPILTRLNEDFSIPSQQIYPGILLSNFQFSKNKRSKYREMYSLTEKNVVIGCISRLSYEKGLDILIEVAKIVIKKLPEVKFIIIGDGDERLNLERQAVELIREKKLLLLGNKSNVNELLNMMDLYIQTSRKEGFGLSVLQAMSTGIPVVGINTGGLSLLIEDGVSGVLIEDINPDSIAKAILDLANDKIIQKKLLDNAKVRSLTFDISSASSKYLNLYLSMNNHV